MAGDPARIFTRGLLVETESKSEHKPVGYYPCDLSSLRVGGRVGYHIDKSSLFAASGGRALLAVLVPLCIGGGIGGGKEDQRSAFYLVNSLDKILYFFLDLGEFTPPVWVFSFDLHIVTNY